MEDLFPDGLDALPVVRNLAVAALSFSSLLPTTRDSVMWPALSFSLRPAAMMRSSRLGELRRRERLRDLLTWQGNERVRDFGCGRGLMAVARRAGFAARRPGAEHPLRQRFG